MSTNPAIAYIEPGGNEARQQRAVLDLATRQAFNVVTICAEPGACAAAVAAGLAEVVLAAVDPRNGLREQVAAAGGRAVFAREPRMLPTLRDLLDRALRRGRTPHDIAELLDAETDDVSGLLRRLGLRQPRRPDGQ